MNFDQVGWRCQYKNDRIDLLGCSVSFCYSGFYLPRWKIMLDAGMPFDGAPYFILLSHLHRDHVQSLFSGLIKGTHRSMIFVPVGSKRYLRNYLVAAWEMQYEKTHSNELNELCKIVECQPGDEFALKAKKSPWIQIRIYQSFHRINSIAFGLGHVKKNKTIDPILLYTGDTTTQIFEDPEIFSYPYILTECTYINELSPKFDSVGQAQERKHIYWEGLQPVVETHPETCFLLCHFSRRLPEKKIIEFFSGVPNVTPMLLNK